MAKFGPWSMPRRYVLALAGFFGFFHVYVLRVNLSIAIVAMTSNRSTTHPNGTTTYVSIKSYGI